jgi:rhodanese-related sulfurtransferase
MAAFLLGAGTNLFRSPSLPLFKPLPALFPGEISLDDAFMHYRRKDAVFWDARAPEAYREAHLPGALALNEVPPQGRMVIVYCSGRLCPKATEKAEDLRDSGYREVWVMPDGIQGWHAAGYLLRSSDE